MRREDDPEDHGSDEWAEHRRHAAEQEASPEEERQLGTVVGWLDGAASAG